VVVQTMGDVRPDTQQDRGTDQSRLMSARSCFSSESPPLPGNGRLGSLTSPEGPSPGPRSILDSEQRNWFLDARDGSEQTVRLLLT